MKSLFFVLLFTIQAQAGFIIGNGGNVVQCQWQQAPDSFQLLDFFEAYRLNSVLGETLSFTQTESKKQDEALNYAFDLLKVLDPQGAAILQKWREDFHRESKQLFATEFGLIQDSFHFSIPSNCRVHQAVIQGEPVLLEPRYVINGDLWSRLTEFHRAGLILHEILYRLLKTSDSRPVRLITAMLFSDQFAKLSIDQQKTTLRKLQYFRY